MLLDWLVLVGLYLLFFCRRWWKRGKRFWLVNSLCYLYVCLVIMVTLMPVLSSLGDLLAHEYRWMEMRPYRDFFNDWGDPIPQILLNVLMMVPFGFFFTQKQRQSANHKFAKTIFATFIFSLCIELLQPLISRDRIADVTDLINNTIGGGLGCLCYFAYATIKNFLKGSTKADDEVKEAEESEE